MCPYTLVLLWEVPLYHQVNGSIIQPTRTHLSSTKDAAAEVSLFNQNELIKTQKEGSIEVLCGKSTADIVLQTTCPPDKLNEVHVN